MCPSSAVPLSKKERACLEGAEAVAFREQLKALGILWDGRCFFVCVLQHGLLRQPERFLAIIKAAGTLTKACDELRALLYAFACEHREKYSLGDRDLRELRASSTSSVPPGFFRLASDLFGLNIRLLNDGELAAQLEAETVGFAEDPETVALLQAERGDQSFGQGQFSDVVVASGHFTPLFELWESFLPAAINAVLGAERDTSSDKTVMDLARLKEARIGYAHVVKLVEEVVRFFVCSFFSQPPLLQPPPPLNSSVTPANSTPLFFFPFRYCVGN